MIKLKIHYTFFNYRLLNWLLFFFVQIQLMRGGNESGVTMLNIHLEDCPDWTEEPGAYFGWPRILSDCDVTPR